MTKRDTFEIVLIIISKQGETIIHSDIDEPLLIELCHVPKRDRESGRSAGRVYINFSSPIDNIF